MTGKTEATRQINTVTHDTNPDLFSDEYEFLEISSMNKHEQQIKGIKPLKIF